MSNKLFPVCVIDDFYTDPYAVREFALSQKFYPNTDGRWPGARTEPIHIINENLFHHFCEKILSIFYDMNQIQNYRISTLFQKIKPFHSDKYNEINRGFIHRDGVLFGGVIYLDTDPEETTGTSIYTFKNKWYCNNDLDNKANNIKFKKYGGTNLTDDDMISWNESRNQYFESVRVENVFNRCILFDGNSFHGVPFFGTKERLTQVFFVEDIIFDTSNNKSSSKYPLIKDNVG
jgi:hypothetical protein